MLGAAAPMVLAVWGHVWGHVGARGGVAQTVAQIRCGYACSWLGTLMRRHAPLRVTEVLMEEQAMGAL